MDPALRHANVLEGKQCTRRQSGLRFSAHVRWQCKSTHHEACRPRKRKRKKEYQSQEGLLPFCSYFGSSLHLRRCFGKRHQRAVRCPYGGVEQCDNKSYCLCGKKPCHYASKSKGCRNGSECDFCHAEHQPKTAFDRPSRRTRNKWKGIVGDCLRKGADATILAAHAELRPYGQQLLKQHLGTAGSGSAENPGNTGPKIYSRIAFR